MSKRGLYIVIEGVDGSGKSTQFKKILSFLGNNTVGVREPGGTNMAEEVRKLILDKRVQRSPRTNLYLFSAARAELIDTIIRPQIQAGQIVLSDRNWLSTVAYQAGGEDVSLTEILTVTKQATGGFFEPDITIFLDLDPKISIERIKKSEKHGGEDYFDTRSLDFFNKARAAYLTHLKLLKGVMIIDANAPEQVIFERITQKLASLLADDTIPTQP